MILDLHCEGLDVVERKRPKRGVWTYSVVAGADIKRSVVFIRTRR